MAFEGEHLLWALKKAITFLSFYHRRRQCWPLEAVSVTVLKLIKLYSLGREAFILLTTEFTSIGDFEEHSIRITTTEMMRKRTFENSDVSRLSPLLYPLDDLRKTELLILQPACKLQDLQIQDTIEEVLRTNLQGVCYTAWDSDARCDALSQIIKQKLRTIQHQFASFNVVVLIGQANDTGIEKASHKVWKPEYDSFASAWFRNESLFAVGTVFATYATRNF